LPRPVSRTVRHLRLRSSISRVTVERTKSPLNPRPGACSCRVALT
jgi:hypothetical protein